MNLADAVKNFTVQNKLQLVFSSITIPLLAFCFLAFFSNEDLKSTLIWCMIVLTFVGITISIIIFFNKNLLAYAPGEFKTDDGFIKALGTPNQSVKTDSLWPLHYENMLKVVFYYFTINDDDDANKKLLEMAFPKDKNTSDAIKKFKEFEELLIKEKTIHKKYSDLLKKD